MLRDVGVGMTNIKKTKDRWERLARWWSDDIGDGDEFHQAYVFPGMLEVLELNESSNVLEIGCGSGALSRQIAGSGCSVLATDFCESFINIAKQKPNENIKYCIADATDFDALVSLKNTVPFDRIVASMVLHDMWTLDALFDALPQLLKRNGSFVFSLPHPYFNRGGIDLNFHEDTPNICLSTYGTPYESELYSKPGQPVKQFAYHRPLHLIFSSLFKKGMVLDKLLEPASVELSMIPDTAWKHLPDIPPAMICRFVFKPT